jgi:hypothetical protein
MIDVNLVLNSELKELPYPSAFYYPSEKAKLPCISYYGLHDEKSFSSDNNGGFQESYVSVDVWAKTPAQCSKIAIEVEELLSQKGWVRENMRDIAPEGGVYHKNMRFVRTFII